MKETGETPRRPRLHGRRKGRPLSPSRQALLDARLEELALDPAAIPANAKELFGTPVRELRLEIGFGGGEHLRHQARGEPEIGFIGVEPFLNGFAKMVAAVAADGLRNVRLFAGDAAMLLERLPAASLARVDLLYPDPWPKRRHWKRRFVSPANLDLLARVLAPGGEFRFASDIPSYVDWALSHLLRRQDFAWTAETADDWRLPWPGWPSTRYEAKALREGRSPAYLTFQRL